MGIRKKIKKFLAEREINKKYGKYFTEKTIKKDWDKHHLNKVALINAAVLKTLRRKKRCVYLEIGCDDNNTFNSISLPKKYKYGVDPRSGGMPYPSTGRQLPIDISEDTPTDSSVPVMYFTT